MNRLISFIILMVLLALVLFSCAPTRYCKPPKGSKDYAVLREGTIMDSAHVVATLVSVKYGMMGYKHTFVTENKDTIIRFFNCQFEPKKLYLVAI